MNIDQYWEMASVLESILILMLSGYLYGRFVKSFFNNNRYHIIVGASFFLTLFVLYLIPYEMLGMIADAVGMAVIFVVMYLLDKRNVRQKIFLTMIMYLIGWFTHGITAVFRDILFNKILYSPTVLSKSEMDYFCIFLVIEGVCLTIRYSLMAFFLYVIDRVYRYKKEDMSTKELVLMLSIPLSSIVGYAAFTFFSESYLNDTQTYIAEVYLEYDWIKALYQTLSFGAIFSAIVLYRRIKDGYRKEKESFVLYEQIESMKRHMKEVEELYGSIRGIKHDMGNHVMILENLCRKNQPQEAMDYLSGLRKVYQEIAEEVKSGNPVTDVIIEEKKKAAVQKEITFASNFFYPKEAQINVFDVSIILNNGLDNALEGAQSCSNPYVRVSSYQENNAYMIEIENSFAGEIVLDEETGLPITSKEDKENHGYGFTNIRKVTGKYFGDVSIEQKEGAFFLRVMLMLR